MKRTLVVLAALLAGISPAAGQLPRLTVHQGGRYLSAEGKPFFWLGDTGWLLLGRLDRDETEHYLRTRAEQGFTVIQVMILHHARMTNRYDAPALVDGDPARPRTTPGGDPAQAGQYDYWDHLDWVVDRAAAHGLYLALVPAWGSLANHGDLTEANAPTYGRFLAERYGKRSNIIWLNGGDTFGHRKTAVWEELGSTIKAGAPDQLMTFHPIGRTDSAWTFHDARWLDFNMFQSGHRSSAQPGYRNEDNWRFVAEDLARVPRKPTIDGEPSYENIPHGLDDHDGPRWGADDARRYAYWAVFAGAFGHTYGENSVMQMHAPERYKRGAYDARLRWDAALTAPAATQMVHLKKLMLSRPFFDRVPDPSMIIDPGIGHDRVLATRGARYAMAYAYSGRPFRMRLGILAGAQVRAAWFDPRTGASEAFGSFANNGERLFTPPAAGDDWVLLLDAVESE
ncbi:hypothetical protein FHS96_003506 [Sphingomonas zeicaulis]|uniref:glycoside hydrolase family 140 protein n=1 Tax=Sphingomonas zeicaulis TaxID=1632740 RepID=UPI003D1CB24C